MVGEVSSSLEGERSGVEGSVLAQLLWEKVQAPGSD